MYVEILVEDKSGAELLEILVPKIIGQSSYQSAYRIRSFRGLGTIPKNLKGAKGAKSAALLQKLPGILDAYGKMNPSPDVFVVCDLDEKCLKEFRQELLGILERCREKPKVCFCIAVKEIEAWLLGDKAAIMRAFPGYRQRLLEAYENEETYGAWETLADILAHDGAAKLKARRDKEGYHVLGYEKRCWAQKIGPEMNIMENRSPSFQRFRDKLRKLANCERLA